MSTDLKKDILSVAASNNQAANGKCNNINNDSLKSKPISFKPPSNALHKMSPVQFKQPQVLVENAKNTGKDN